MIGAPEYARPSGWPDVALVDTDVHITPRAIGSLLPYLPARWRDYIRESGVQSLESDLYPPRSPLSAIPGAWPEDGPPGSDLGLLRTQLLTPGPYRAERYPVEVRRPFVVVHV